MSNEQIPARLTLTEASGVVTFEAPKEIAGKRRFQMVGYTGAAMAAPVLGKVVIDLDGMDGVGGKRKPILRQHDDNRIAGYADAIAKGPDGLVFSGTLSGKTEAGREVADLADEGFPWQASVGIEMQRLEPVKAGASVTVNGAEFAGPGVIIRQSRLRECSFVPLGADGATSAVVFSDAAGSIPLPQAKEDPMTLEQFKQFAAANPDATKEFYEAGFAAGKTQGVAEATAAAAPKAATVNELLAAFSDKAFCMDMLAANDGSGATLADAYKAFSAKQAEALTAAAAEAADLKNKLAQATTGQPAVGFSAPAEPAAVDTSDPKAVASAEWDNKPEVRKGFSSKDRYVAIRVAEMSGQFRSVSK